MRKKVFFTTKEECQAFCDYLNRDSEVFGYDYDINGKLLREVDE